MERGRGLAYHSTRLGMIRVRISSIFYLLSSFAGRWSIPVAVVSVSFFIQTVAQN
ncbi:hypothetical protein BCR44DRAFT_266838 [Catenaria anguillulae PL171]|uniref:Uncharacterized protein n=1 Tax=Catenaria anguillulae PL171 TaxID=765915 RepID=A0A1Y2HDD7_9FUNG|nr:hypothetical protein BCR44DRAFT_266838 [Catenaria anguillulae PL171]